MKSGQAGWISALLKEHENCNVHWRVIKKYGDDWEQLEKTVSRLKKKKLKKVM